MVAVGKLGLEPHSFSGELFCAGVPLRPARSAAAADAVIKSVQKAWRWPATRGGLNRSKRCDLYRHGNTKSWQRLATERGRLARFQGA
jgi:hypothetical protein